MISCGISSYSTGNHVTFHGISTDGAFENKASYGTNYVNVYHVIIIVACAVVVVSYNL